MTNNTHPNLTNPSINNLKELSNDSFKNVQLLSKAIYDQKIKNNNGILTLGSLGSLSVMPSFNFN